MSDVPPDAGDGGAGDGGDGEPSTGEPVLGIVASRADEASMHVHEHLLDLADWTAREDGGRRAADGGGTYHTCPGAVCRTVEERHLETTDAADRFDADLAALLFVSRHAGETGPLLTTHATGNLGPAEHGGAPNELATAAPGVVGPVLAGLADAAPDGYDVSMECTHHGPSRVGCPSQFVELGSGPEQWDDPAAARAVAAGALAARGVDPTPERSVAVFGGGHYAPRATRIARETDWGVGHVCADWGLSAVPDDATRRRVAAQAVRRSGATRAVDDTDEGTGDAVTAALADLEVPVVGERFLRETTGVPLPTVRAVEGALGTVADGVRYGDCGRTGATDAGADAVADVAVVALPPTLVETAAGVDPESAVEAVASTTVAHETAEAGARPGDRVAVPAEDERGRAAVVDALLAVCERAYDVARSGDVVVLTRSVFDPAAAAEAGVPEGPAFGRLADGEPVTVDGETVRPEDVRTTERTEIRLSGG
ncbi:MAG: D-aminoacyl-tRNA deacylase [Halobacteriaceae archaeon]